MPEHVGLVASQELSEEALLALIEWQVVDQVERRSLRKIKTAQRLLTAGNVEWVLGACHRIPARSCGEDFARIVQRLAPGKGPRAAQTVPILNAEFTLQSVVPGPGRVFTVANVREVAIGPATRCARSASRGARSYSGRNKGTESVRYQPAQRRVCINGLEVAHDVVANVADFQDHLACQFMLDAQCPFLRVRLFEIVRHTRIEACARVDSPRNVAQMTATHVTSKESGARQARRSAGHRLRGSHSPRIDDWRRRRHVEENVVISGVISNTVPSTNDGLLRGHTKEMRFPGETNGGTKVFVLVRNLRDSRYGCWRRRIPERRGTGLVRHRYGVEQVDRLTGKLPTQAQIDGQVVLQPPVVSRVSSNVVLLEVKFRRTIRQAQRGDGVLEKVVEIRKCISPVDIWQESIG